MSIWSQIADAIAALRNGEPLSAVFSRLQSPPEHSVGFTIAVIALAAKMAKADGQVTREEVAAFREVFAIPPEDEKNAARVYNLARQDVAGYQQYARQIASMFETRRNVLCDLMECLFHIAMADGGYHPAEDKFLKDVSGIFGLTDRQFRGLRARFVKDAEPDPFDVLGLSQDATIEEARAAWRKAIRACHPDQVIARGLPEEAVRMAEARVIALNNAWEAIQKEAA